MAASGVYLLLALILFRRAIFTAHSAIGFGADPYLFQWHLAWVAHALGHGTNPLFSRYVAVPNGGENLMYYTSVPLAGLVLWPVTALGGSLLSYNVLMVTSVVVSAAAAYAMCARFVSWRPAALVGGAVYGFSPYMAAQSSGHPHMTMAWFPPAVVIVADSIARGRRSPISLGVLFGIAVTAQLLLGTEVLVTSAVVAATGTVIWVTLFRSDEGTANLWRRGLPALGAAAVTVAILGSFPLYMLVFAGHRIGLRSAVQPLGAYVNDITGFLVPGRAQLVSTAGTRSYTKLFSGNYVEATAYLGVPLLLLLGFHLWRRWADRTVRLPLIFGAACAVLSLGSRLRVHGVVRAERLPLPGAILSRTPVLWNIVAARLMLYGYLAVALTLATIIDRGARERRNLRILGVAVGLIFLLPVSVPALHQATPQAFRTVARGGGLVLVTPMSAAKEEMFWQANTGFSARLVGGFTLARRRQNALLDALSAGEATGSWSLPSTQQAASVRDSATELGVTVVVDDPDPQQHARRAFLVSVFGPAQTSPDGFAIWNLRAS
jgi:hypothetical protein